MIRSLCYIVELKHDRSWIKAYSGDRILMSYVARLHAGRSCKFVSDAASLTRKPRQLAVFQSHSTAFCKVNSCKTWISSAGVNARGTRKHSRLSVQAAWGDDIVWSPAKIVRSHRAAEGFQTILLDVGSKAAKAYTTAGQYLQVRLKGSKPGFYAIASSPHESTDGTLQLLIRRRGENSEELSQAKEGTEVEASPVDGPGFRVGKVGPDTASQILIFATGSGISPIKALIESGNLQAGKRKAVELYWGTHDSEATPYKDEVKEWQSQGIKVNHVYSKDGLGYVQDVYEKTCLSRYVKPQLNCSCSSVTICGLFGDISRPGDILVDVCGFTGTNRLNFQALPGENAFNDGSSVAVILCGHKDMADTISQQMQASGVKKENILTNF